MAPSNSAGRELNDDLSTVPLYRDVPLWITHSIDDPVVDYRTASLAIADALEATGAPSRAGRGPATSTTGRPKRRLAGCCETARRNDSHILFTTYAAGTTPVGGHFSWIPTYLNDVMIDWLYSQERAAAAAKRLLRPSRAPAKAAAGGR